MNRYILTNHAMLQYAKRFAPNSHQRLSDCIIINNKKEIDRFKQDIIEEINQSEEDRSFKNNTKRLLYLYETHGYENRYHFYKHKNKEFVGIERSNFILILTCYPIGVREKMARSRYKRRDKLL